MENFRKLSELFEKQPAQWGNRGDPHLWRNMQQALSSSPLPATEAELVAIVENLFEQLTGYPISTPDAFFVQKYAHGGLTSGYILPKFWRETGLPFLRSQFIEIKKAG